MRIISFLAVSLLGLWFILGRTETQQKLTNDYASDVQISELNMVAISLIADARNYVRRYGELPQSFSDIPCINPQFCYSGYQAGQSVYLQKSGNSHWVQVNLWMNEDKLASKCALTAQSKPVQTASGKVSLTDCGFIDSNAIPDLASMAPIARSTIY